MRTAWRVWTLMMGLSLSGCGAALEEPWPEGLEESRGAVSVTDEKLSDGTTNLLDPEFSFRSSRYTWCNMATGVAWVGTFDPETGALTNSSGQEVVLDRQCPKATVNSPEWGYTASGEVIAFTRQDEASGRLWLAYATPSGPGGEWVATDIANTDGSKAVYPSENALSTDVRVLYRGPDSAGSPLLTKLVTSTAPGSVVSPVLSFAQWVPDTFRAVLTRPVSGVSQVFLYDAVAGTPPQQLTTTPGSKATPFMWRAPELGNALVLAAVVDGFRLEIYRQVRMGDWQLIHTITMPRVISSPEQFTWGGKSYLLFLSGKDVYVAGILASENFLKKVSGDEVLDRSEPEVGFGTTQPFFYFSAPDPVNTANLALWKTARGLY